MVRVKSRWIILQVEFDRDLLSNQLRSPQQGIEYFPTRKELCSTIRDYILVCSGEAAIGVASSSNLQGTYKSIYTFASVSSISSH